MGCFNSKPAATSANSPSFTGLGRSSLLSSANPSVSTQFHQPHQTDTIPSLHLQSPRVALEQSAAGWPTWLTTSAAEAIHGMLPLSPDAFRKLEKIGEGTYSHVFKAREIKSGRIMAIKKVRFDNLKEASVRFMAREIAILRRLNHPNVIPLEGIIASKSSQCIYLVFEYMEHDLAGLTASPEISFNESQVKCYMKQLLLGIEHCHYRSILHRDIKSSNILINNQGNLKIADFGLANILTARNKNNLTSCVVTLWYRPPEVLMGSTAYGAGVDMWSVGCVLAEMYLRKPLLKGRTEVEQVHKIFRLCGTPSNEYWEQCNLPNAPIFRHQHRCENSFHEKFKGLPTEAVELISKLLRIDPEKRCTASSALASKYFTTPPYPCDSTSLPKYPPTKEMDAKHKFDLRRRRNNDRSQEILVRRKQRAFHKAFNEHRSLINFLPRDDTRVIPEVITRADTIDTYTKMLMQRGNARRKITSPFGTTSEIARVKKVETESNPSPSGIVMRQTRRGDTASSLSYDGSSLSFADSSIGLHRESSLRVHGRNDQFTESSSTRKSLGIGDTRISSSRFETLNARFNH